MNPTSATYSRVTWDKPLNLSVPGASCMKWEHGSKGGLRSQHPAHIRAQYMLAVIIVHSEYSLIQHLPVECLRVLSAYE